MQDSSKIKRAIGIGEASIDVFPSPILASRAPTSTDTAYPLGQKWIYGSQEYTFTSAGNWVLGGITSATQIATVTLSSAEILALATTPKTLVAAPGAGKIIMFEGALLLLNYGSIAYTETDDNLGIKYTDASGVQVSNTIEATGFIDQTADTVTNAIPVLNTIVTAAGCVNQALVLDNLGDNYAAGNSTMNVIVSYRIVSSGL